jgi:putative oxidoreductase
MFRKLIHTNEDFALAWLRLFLGVIFFAHGAQKALGWFGGAGYARTIHHFTHTTGIPEPLAVLAVLAEFLGGIGLIVGFLTRIAAFGILIDMLVAVFLVHLPNGFFMNWAGSKAGEGFEYHLLAIAIAATVMVRGAGGASLDHAMERPRVFRTAQPYPMPSGR